MPRIICLANSWKHGDRCIAGIDPTTGQWLRPISKLEDGRILEERRLVAGREPALLDILDIPLADSVRPDFSFECENRDLLPGKWRRVGQAQPLDLLKYCRNECPILHNRDRAVSLTYLTALPFQDRCTLQLLYVKELTVQGLFKARGGRKWQATLTTSARQSLNEITITDPVFVERLEAGYRPQHPCLITVSLSMPFRPKEDWEGDDPCWKLIAGVIELSEAALILVEMERLGWSMDQGRLYLQQTYGKRSRSQLTSTQLTQFLNYLRSLPTPAPQLNPNAFHDADDRRSGHDPC